MQAYLAKLAFGILMGKASKTNTFETQLRLVIALNTQEAMYKAEQLGRSQEDILPHEEQGSVCWRFIGVTDIIALPALNDGLELESVIHEPEDSDSFESYLKRKIALQRLNIFQETLPLQG